MTVTRLTLPIIVLLAGCAAHPRPGFDPIQIIDLTHVLDPHIPVFPGGTPLSLHRTADPDEDGYYMNALTLGEHTGTHVDAPVHFSAGAQAVHEISANDLVGPGIVIDIRAQCTVDPDYELTYLDIKHWESQHGRIPNGAVLLIHTGWASRWDHPTRYLNADEQGVLHFPGVSAEAAEYLAKYRDPAGVGIDTLSIDHGRSKTFGAHKALSRDGIYLIENLANLDRVPPTGATIVVAPVPIRTGSGAPCRVFALLPSTPVRTRAAPRGERYLVEFGWDLPSERTLASAANAGTPFDGAVFDAELVADGGKAARFSWKAFGPQALTEAHVRRIVDDLSMAPTRFRKHSFMRFNATPGSIDWFDDWSGILANARLTARVARQAELAGILFDVEQYQGEIFNYQARPPGRSFADYEAKARDRGAEFMRAINAECPDIVILLTFGYSVSDRNRFDAEYGLLPPFLDGMFNARTNATRIIDGYEYAYPFKSRRAFERGRAEILSDSNGRCEVGFGVWLDWYSAQRGWDVDEFSDNWFSPPEFGAAVRHALDHADGYVWIYSELVNWWTGENVPPPYLEALRVARRAPRSR